MTTQRDKSEAGSSQSNHLLTWLALGVILFAGLILRVLYLREIVNEPDFCIPRVDAGFHDYWARGLATGDWTIKKLFYEFHDPQIRSTPYFRPPGYPYFLAFIYYLTDGSYLAARIVQIGIGLLNCVLAYLLGRWIFNRVTGLIFAAFMSFYWVFIYFEGELLAPVLLVTLGLTIMLIMCRWYDRLRFGYVLCAGVVFGLFALVRPNILVVGPVIACWLFWITCRRVGAKRAVLTVLAFTVAGALTIAPAGIRNYLVADDLVLITSNAGLNFYIGNNEETTGYSADVPMLEQIEGLENEAWLSSDYPKIVRGVESLQGRQMKYSEVSNYFSMKAFKFIREHPGKTLRLMAKKAALFWGPVEISNNRVIHYHKQNSQMLRYIPGFAMALSFAVAGCVWFFIDHRRLCKEKEVGSFAVKRQLATGILVLLFIVTYFASFLPFFVAGRYRVAITPFLFLFGAYGLYRTAQQAGSHDINKILCLLIFYILLYAFASLQVVRYEPDIVTWHSSRAACYCLAGQFERGIAEYSKAVRLRPNREIIRRNLADALVQEKRYDEAVEHYTKALWLKPGQSEVYNKLGIVVFRKGNTDEAVRHFLEALRLNPDQPDVQSNLGLALFGQGKYDQAVSRYETALEINPNLAYVHFNLGRALAAQGKFAKAVESCKTSLDLEPARPGIHRFVGDLLLRLGENEKAVSHYEDAINLNPNLPEVQNRLGEIYHQQGQYEKALAHWSEALKINPEQVGVLNNIAWLKAAYKDKKFHEPKTAVQLARKACELTNYKGLALLHTLSVAYAADGRFDEAIKTAEKALRITKYENQAQLVDKINSHLELFKRGMPYYDSAQPEKKRQP